MTGFKETIKKRWLLVIAYFFQIVIPIALIIELILELKQTAVTKIPAFVLILGLLYIGFFSKIVNEKIKKLKEGAFKIFVSEINYLVPFGVVTLIIYLVEHLFDGFYKWCLVICGCIFFGTLLKLIEYAINKEYIHKKKINSLALEQIEIEKAKQELLEEIGE